MSPGNATANTCQAPRCGKPLPPQKGGGPRRKWCSIACRQRAYMTDPEKKATKARADRAWRARNPGYYNRRQAALRAEIDAIKETTPCADCGETFPGRPEVMDFDHVHGTKIGDVATLVSCRGREVVFEEIAKCELVCANCHRTRSKNRPNRTDLMEAV